MTTAFHFPIARARMSNNSIDLTESQLASGSDPGVFNRVFKISDGDSN